MPTKKKTISIASRKAKARTAQNWVAEKVAKLLNLPWGKDCMIAAREMGQTGVDIRLVGEARNRFNWSVEVKNQEKVNLFSAIDQAKENQMKDTNWLVILKKNRSDYIAVLNADVFFDLLALLPEDRRGCPSI
jgi:hypothetical protein